VVIALAVRRLRRDPRRLGFGRRLTIAETPGGWCLPFYVWAWQASQLLSAQLADPRDPLLTARIRDPAIEAVFISLLYLLTLRTIGTLITNRAPMTLGLVGHSRTAVTAAVLSVFLDAALLYWFISRTGGLFGLPAHPP
jgi:hypothetical protein